VNRNLTPTLSANESLEENSTYSYPMTTNLHTRHSEEIKSSKNEESERTFIELIVEDLASTYSLRNRM
jgi:hypothetical protein